MKSNYEKAIEFVEECGEEQLREILKQLIFWNPDEFVENFIAEEYNL